jgi:hypothetical protein
MMDDPNTLFALSEMMRKKAAEYFDLLAARTDAEFEAAFDALLERAIAHLEKNRKNFEQLDEVGLSGCLAAALSIPGLTVTQEAHSNGHVDITIEADHCVPMRRRLGEAKIYRGPEYHVQGLSQLLKRYTSGREGRGILIVYVRKPDISGLLDNIRKKMDLDHPCEQQGKTIDSGFKWSFLSKHAHSCGDILDVSHVGCNLYHEPSA